MIGYSHHSWNPAYVDDGTDRLADQAAADRDELLRLGAIQAALGHYDDADDLADEVSEGEEAWFAAYGFDLPEPEAGLRYENWTWGEAR